MAGRRRNEEKAAQWRNIMEECAASGLTARRFLAERGISACVFYYWKKRLADPERAVDGRQLAGPKFTELRLAGGGTSGIEVVLEAGVRLAVRPDFDEATLRRLVDLLGCRPPC